VAKLRFLDETVELENVIMRVWVFLMEEVGSVDSPGGYWEIFGGLAREK
jgi:hypothetical protein